MSAPHRIDNLNIFSNITGNFTVTGTATINDLNVLDSGSVTNNLSVGTLDLLNRILGIGTAPANYTLTFPAAPPGISCLLESDNAGNLSWMPFSAIPPTDHINNVALTTYFNTNNFNEAVASTMSTQLLSPPSYIQTLKATETRVSVPGYYPLVTDVFRLDNLTTWFQSLACVQTGTNQNISSLGTIAVVGLADALLNKPLKSITLWAGAFTGSQTGPITFTIRVKNGPTLLTTFTQTFPQIFKPLGAECTFWISGDSVNLDLVALGGDTFEIDIQDGGDVQLAGLINPTYPYNTNFTGTGNFALFMPYLKLGFGSIKSQLSQVEILSLKNRDLNGSVSITTSQMQNPQAYTLQLPPAAPTAYGQYLTGTPTGALLWADPPTPPVLSASGTLSAFNLLNLFATPYPLVAAQGPGTLIVVDSIVFNFVQGLTTYTGGGNLTAYYDNSNVLAVPNSVIPGFLTEGTNGIGVLPAGPFALNNISASVLNAAIMLKNDVGAFLNGSGTLKYKVYYKVVSSFL